jgi:hypothetical protein
VELDQPLRKREAEAGSLALLEPRLRLLELLEDPLVIPTSPLTRAARTSTAPPAGVNFTAFDSRLKMTCLIRRSSPSMTSTSGAAASSTCTPSSVARSRTMTTPRSSASRSENRRTSSST